MARTQVRFLRDYDHVVPATVLVSYVNNEKVLEIPVPEKRFTYTAGQVVECRSKKDAKSFVAAFGDDVCVIL